MLFASGRVRIELVCLGLIAVLALGLYLFPLEVAGRFSGMEVAFGGFGHEALIAICGLMIVGRGLVVTGALDPAAHALARVWRFNRGIGMLCSLLVCAALSMFINDTPVLVLALPILLSLSARAGVSASKTLMPVNCAILIGGMSTTIGTSTNILVASIAAEQGMPRLGIFDFTGIALIAGAVALPYLWLVMPRLLPERSREETEAPRRYDAVLHAGETTGSQTLGTMRKRLPDLQVGAVVKHGIGASHTADAEPVRSGDWVLVSGTAEQLRDGARTIGATLADPAVLAALREAATDAGADERLAQVVIGADSPLTGQSVKTARLAQRFGIAVLGASSSSEAADVHRIPVGEELRVGDVLLVRGTAARLKAFESGAGVHLLDGGEDLPRSARAVWALLIAAAVIALVATRILPTPIAALAGSIAMFATGCVKFDRIGRALSAEVIVLVAASIALGRALVETGAADWLGGLLAAGLQQAPAAVVLASLMIFITVLTNFVSNAAAAAIGTPIAISLATDLGINPEPLVLAVLFGCNLCYVTPMAYQTNLLIMGAARYEFRDFVRAGLPLAVLMIITLALVLVRRYGL